MNDDTLQVSLIDEWTKEQVERVVEHITLATTLWEDVESARPVEALANLLRSNAHWVDIGPGLGVMWFEFSEPPMNDAEATILLWSHKALGRPDLARRGAKLFIERYPDVKRITARVHEHNPLGRAYAKACGMREIARLDDAIMYFGEPAAVYFYEVGVEEL